MANIKDRTNEKLADHLCDGSQSIYSGILKALNTKDTQAEEMMRAERTRHTMELDAISIKSIGDFVL